MIYYKYLKILNLVLKYLFEYLIKCYSMLFFLITTITLSERIPFTIIGTNDVHGKLTPIVAQK